MISWLQHRWTSLCLLVLALGAFFLFLYGFFPLKYHSGKLSHMDDLPNFIDGVSIDGQEVYNSGENSVVLMVIDGLRYDFVTDEYMPYTDQLLKNKSACIYVTVAEPPTVTMPRIKSPESKKARAQWRRTINFWRHIFASVTFLYLYTTCIWCWDSGPKKKQYSHAMMTGSVSTFVDVALNFGAPAVRADSVLRAAASRGRRSVMYGDDTWLRLFPSLWAEADGTTSFYVTDYTEVDNNVTRHLDKILAPDENKKPNFDFLVLHYLGLDHIGHLEGARSPKIKPKLQEMDEVVKKIYTAMEKWDRRGVLIVCGDHGMRDAGGHGGASPAEVLVPLVVAASDGFTCPYPLGRGGTVAQVDVAPTAAWLLNAPLPADSAGRVLPALLPADVRQHLYLLHVLAQHNARLAHLPTHQELYKQYRRAERLFAQYLASGQQSAGRTARDLYDAVLDGLAARLADTAVNYDLFAIGLALLMLYCIGISLLCVTLYSLQPESGRKQAAVGTSRHSGAGAGALLAFTAVLAATLAVLTLACFITETSSQLCSFNPTWTLILILSAAAITMTYFITKTGLERTTDASALRQVNAIDYLLVGGTLFHAWSFFGTSFIEEEHLTWYFFWNTLMFFVLMRCTVVVVVFVGKLLARSTEVQDKPELRHRMADVGFSILPKWLVLIALHRYLRTMNQTGDRWLFLPDTADWLNAPENSMYLHFQLILSTLATFVICFRNLKHTNNIMYMQTILTSVAAVTIVLWRCVMESINIAGLPDISSWDDVLLFDIFLLTIITQFVIEFLSYVGVLRNCGAATSNTYAPSDKKFVYNKPKEKTEDYVFDTTVDEPWNKEEVNLNMARSLSYLMLNSLMLILMLLMRPHNVVMVPSVYLTCSLTTKCMDHKLLEPRSPKNTEIVDVVSQSLVHLWIGLLFFFYQGNSNSLASVDLVPGYVGLREYSAWRVAARMGLHTHAGPALAGAHLYAGLAARAHGWRGYLESVWRASNIYALHRVYCVAVYGAVALVFRHHLFVWSVFSPKLLYDLVAAVFCAQALATVAAVVAITHAAGWLARRTRL